MIPSKPSHLVHTLALGVLAFAAASPATAALITTSPSAAVAGGSVSAVDGEGSETTTNSANLGSINLNQFNASLGVLTGARLLVQWTHQLSTTVNAQPSGATTGFNGQVTSSGTGTSTVGLSTTGANWASQLTAAASCRDNYRSGCSGTPVTTSQSWSVMSPGSAAVAEAALDSYVGTGQVSVTGSASVTAQQLNNAFGGPEGTTSTVTWSNGSVAFAYEYLLHAAASFDATGLSTLDLAFGNVALGSVAALDFGVFNLFAADRVGLDLDSVSGTGDTARLTTNLSLFSALAAGNGNLFQAMLDTTTVGDFEASYILHLSDADVGAASSRHTYQLTLNLSGSVFNPNATVDDPPPPRQPRNDVPEPATLALLAAGLVGLGASRRRAP